MSEEKTNEGIKDLENLFDLGETDSDVEDIYNEDTGDATFEDKKVEIQELLSEEKEENGDTKSKSSKDIIVESINTPQVIVNKEVIEPKEPEKIFEKIEVKEPEKPNIVVEESDDEMEFDTGSSFLVGEETEEEKEPKKEEPKKEEVKKTEPKQEEVAKVEVKEEAHEIEKVAESKEPEVVPQIVEAKEPAVIPKENSSHHWRLSHQDPKFNHFYKMKKERIQTFLSYGEVPYDDWVEELMKARVDLSSLVFDLDHLSRQMQQVQQHQYRIGEIRMRVNSQFNWCKRSLEFLRGKLAQIAYEKPIEKFNGVVYDHLYDIEDYLQKLEVLKDNSEIITKNLDKAAEVISRRVTIVMMEVKTDSKGTRYAPRDGEEDLKAVGSSAIEPMKQVDLNDVDDSKKTDVDKDLEDFDTFEIGEVKEEPKVKKKGWALIPKKIK